MLSRISVALAVLVAGVFAYAAGPSQNAERWRRLYFYERLDSSLVINDFKFLNAQRGIAAGFLLDKNGKIKPTALNSDDGGVHWTLAPLKEVPISLFFLDEKHGWMVADKSIWQSQDGGHAWAKISSLDDAVRVHFVNPQHGWAVGEQKKVYETTDGGKAWTELPAAAQPESTPELTVYNWIDFAGVSAGIITGWNQPPSKSLLPDWMSPTSQRSRKETPRVSIFLQTKDGGKTWDASTGSLFGHVTCVRLALSGYGLGVIEFSDSFEWPSEVFRIDWNTAKSDRVFREKNQLITDVALPPASPAYIAGIEKQDRLTDSPVPGKLKVWRSDDLDNWQPMEVDYRATAHKAMISAVDAANVWVATDTGTILKLTAPK
jgi:Photosynthesis system II assembly factor YCF48